MQTIKRLLAALITRHMGQTDKLTEDGERAATLCASGALTAEEYNEVLALLPGE